ncbi:hypothetical protein MCAG_00861 [Micromonospora sp. ATCC 39149]|uniref:Uncharacterized protein n=1 Tax=Micromonospora carbonacea TaxID=47853 RepID=A0A7D5YAS2_9ACTN|nr:AAA family ATPase [Micromonospora sp. ATCC 39149]EEP70534.1 hypothetical protein MCAG_00861 [Micromonospora sp. ATCC 39149]QLJ96917.1 hypothetical protein HZU44_18745 [Micromonospora carbonacea]
MPDTDLFFEETVGRYVDHARFVPRDWLADRVEAHLADPECRFVLITGAPGTGKSALVAWLARRRPLGLRYFIRADSVRALASGSVRSVLLRLGHQLAVRRPELFAGQGLDVSVDQQVGAVAEGGRLVGVRAEQMVVSPFRRTAVTVRQHAGRVAGEVTALDVGRIVSDDSGLDVGALERLALHEPAAALAVVDPAAQLVVLVDALDEIRFRADEASLTQWLASCSPLPANVRVVVSSRPDAELLDRFRIVQRPWLREEVIDTGTESARADVGRYLTSALPDRTSGPGPRLPERVAAAANGNFQYAVAFVAAVESAAARGDRAALERLTQLAELPEGLADLYAFFVMLIRDAVRDMRVAGGGGWLPAWPAVYRPLLSVLALAREPVDRRRLAELSEIEVEPEWVVEALDRLGQFLRRSGDAMELYHASFAEFLVDPGTESRYAWAYVDAAAWHARLADRMVRQHRHDWLHADGYTRRHLVTHAAASGRVDDLLDDLAFVVVADPRFLVPAAGSATSHGAALVRRAAQHLHTEPEPQRAAQLELMARQSGLSGLADRLAAARTDLPWRVRWLHWDAVPQVSQVVGRHAGGVSRIAVGSISGVPAAVAVDDRGTLECWDLSSGLRAAPTRRVGYPNRPYQLSVVEIAGRATAVVAQTNVGYDGGIAFVDLLLGFEPLPRIKTPHEVDRFVAALDGDGGVVVLVHGYTRKTDRRGRARPEVRLWRYDGARWTDRLVDGLPRHFFLHGLGVAGGRLFALAEHDAALYVADATGGPVCRPIRVGHGTIREDLAVGLVGGRPVAAGYVGDLQGVDRYPSGLRMLALDTGETLWAVAHFHDYHDYYDTSSVVIDRVEGREVVVAGGQTGPLRVHDAVDGKVLHPPLRGHTGRLTGLAVLTSPGSGTIVSAGEDGTVRLWRLPRHTHRTPTRSRTDRCLKGRPYAVALGVAGGRRLLAVQVFTMEGYASVIEVIDADSGRHLWQLHPSGSRWQAVLAFHAGAEGDLLIAGEAQGVATIWRLGDGKPKQVPAPALDAPVDGYQFYDSDYVQDYDMALGEDGGDPVLALSSASEVLVRNLRTGELLGPPPGRSAGSHISLGRVAGRLTVAGSDPGLLDVGTGRFRPELRRWSGNVVATAFLTAGQHTWFAVSTRTPDHVFVWPVPRADEPPAEPIELAGHLGWVEVLHGGTLTGRPVFAGADQSGVVTLWSPTGEVLRKLDVGSDVRNLAMAGDLLAVSTLDGVLVVQLAAG